MMITSSPLPSGRTVGEVIATNFAILIPVNHGPIELRPVISTVLRTLVSSFEYSHCDGTVARTCLFGQRRTSQFSYYKKVRITKIMLNTIKLKVLIIKLHRKCRPTSISKPTVVV